MIRKSHTRRTRRSKIKQKKRVYAIYDKDISYKDKYSVTHMPKVYFKSKKEAKKYIKKHNLKNIKILTIMK